MDTALVHQVQEAVVVRSFWKPYPGNNGIILINDLPNSSCSVPGKVMYRMCVNILHCYTFVSEDRVPYLGISHLMDNQDFYASPKTEYDSRTKAMNIIMKRLVKEKNSSVIAAISKNSLDSTKFLINISDCDIGRALLNNSIDLGIYNQELVARLFGFLNSRGLYLKLLEELRSTECYYEQTRAPVCSSRETQIYYALSNFTQADLNLLLSRIFLERYTIRLGEILASTYKTFKFLD